MQILINGDNVVTAACAVGSYDGGIEVEDIPQAVLNCPQAWKYVDGGFTENPDYVEPTEETVTLKERLELVDTTLQDLQDMYFELLLVV